MTRRAATPGPRRRPAEADVCLVQMPYCNCNRPSLALGLLAAYLGERDIRHRVLYANLAFAEEIGLDVYQVVEDAPMDELVGEWTFAGAAFPEHRPESADAYLERVAGRLSHPILSLLRELHPGLDPVRLLRRVRSAATRFVDDTARRVLASRPRIVGCTSMFEQHCAALALLRRVRRLDPSVVTMLGGSNCEGDMGRASHRAFPWVDYVVSGEADAFFGELCAGVLEGGREGPAEPLPRGVFAPRHRHAPPRPGEAPRATLQVMDRAAVPDYSAYFETLAASPIDRFVEPTLLVETSRGCWWGERSHCTFCGLSDAGMAFRAKSPDRVLDELGELAARHGLRRVESVDEILDMRYVDTVLPRLAAEEPGYRIFYEIKANLKREQVRALAAAGVCWVQPGIESFHDDFLRLVGKGSTGTVNLQLLKWAQEEGIRVGWNFLHGAPGESDDWYREMAEWLPAVYHLQPPSGIGKIFFDRFSPYQVRPESFGLRLVPHPSYREVYPLSDEELGDLAYYFVDTAGVTRPPDGRRLPPGVAALRRRIVEWRDLYWRGDERRPLLLAEERQDHLRILDTRPGARRRRRRLEGLARDVYLLCDRAVTRRGLERRFGDGAAGGVDVAALDAAVAELLADRLLIELGGRLLALGPRRISPIPGDAESPGGTIHLDAYMRRHGRESLAAECSRSLLEAPLGELFPERVAATPSGGPE